MSKTASSQPLPSRRKRVRDDEGGRGEYDDHFEVEEGREDEEDKEDEDHERAKTQGDSPRKPPVHAIEKKKISKYKM